MQENPFIQSIELSMSLKYSATRYKQKKKYFSIPDHQLPKKLIFAFGL